MGKTIKNILFVVKYVAAILAAGYVVLVIIMIASQKKFIYFPEREIITTPEKAGLRYEDVFFETADGVKLNGWFIYSGWEKEVILFCHGNADNISYFINEIKQFGGIGFNVFIFDYRGYGKSGGKPGESGIYLDAEAAWDWLIEWKNFSPEDIVVIGRSLGGAIAAHLAAKHKPGWLVLESAFTSIEDMIRVKYPFLPPRFFLKHHYRTVEDVRAVKCPVLVVHSRDDKEVPFAHGLRIFEAASEPKEFLEIKGSHRNGFFTSAEVYQEGLKTFIRKF